MLCCFGRPEGGQKPFSSPQAASAREHDIRITEDIPTFSSENLKLASVVHRTLQRDVDNSRRIAEEPWRARLLERLATWVSSNGLQAAACWVCARERGKCALVAAAPSATRNVFPSAIHGFFLGSTIDLTNDKSSSIASAIISKAPVSVVVLANGQAPSDIPVDLRQLYERLCRTFSNLGAGESNVASSSVWHLAALPLIVQNDAVGALVLAGQLDVPIMNTDAKASAEAAAASRLSTAACLVEEFFGTTASLTCAQDVVALVTAVSDASDHGAAVRNAAARIQALLPRTVITAATSTVGSSPSDFGSTPTTATLPAAVVTHPALASSPPAPHELVVTTGLVVSRGTVTRSCTPSSGVTSNIPASPNIQSTCIGNSGNSAPGAGGGPQLHLYHGSNGRPATILPASETLIARVPIQADMLAAMLNEALAAPVSSAALAAAAAKGPGASAARGGCAIGPQQRHKLLALRCPEEDLPPSQRRADLLALEAAGARTPRGSLILVSCPLHSIMCAVVIYVCAVPPHAVEAAVPGQGFDSAATAASDCPAGSVHGPSNLAGSLAAIDVDCANAAQIPAGLLLADAQLKLILRHVSCAVEVMASALEQRIISSCAVSATRLGSKGPCAVDVTADGSGLVTVSIAGTDGEDSNGFWGSASGPILSGESIPTSQMSAAATAVPSTSPSASATCLSVGRSPEGRAIRGRSDYVKFTPAVKSAADIAVAAVAPLMASPLAASSSAEPHIQSKAVCITNNAGSGTGDQSSSYLTATQAGEGNLNGETATEKTAAVSPAGAARSRSAEEPKPGLCAPAAAGASGETDFMSGPDTTAAVPTLAKLPSIGSRSVAKATLNDTDVSQDTEVDGGAVDTALSAVVATADAEVRGVSVSAGASSSSASGFSGVESTIQALTCDQLDGDCVTARPPPYQRRTADVLTPAQGQEFPKGGAYNKPLVEGGVQTVRLENGIPPLQHFGSSSIAGGGCEVASISGEQVLRAVVRNRSKDWSDQAGEPEALDGRFVPGGCTGGPSAPRLRSIKVLSLDKAAQQLQRTSGSSLVLQPMLPPQAVHLHHQQQNQSFQTQNSAGITAQDNKDGHSANCSAAAMGTAPAAPPPPYMPYMPRRLNRMYLPPAALAMSGSGGMSVAAAGVLAKTALIARPNGASLQTPSSEAAALQPSHLPHLIHLTARAIRLDGSGVALGAPAVTVHPAIGQPSLPAAAPDSATHLSERNSTAIGSTPSMGSEEANQTLLISQAQGRVKPPSALAAELSAHIAAVRDVGVGTDTGIGSLSATASSQKSHQLRDFIIPEDAPLEYTVSETVQMMRMLAQARGAHLSSRMRRVRVTAKIQSAHPESLPSDLPSQISKFALPQSFAAGSTGGAAAAGLFSAVGRGPAATASSSWVLTGVAARRGCVELVFDVVQVRGSSGWGNGGNGHNVHNEQQNAATPAWRRWPAAVSSGGNRGLQGPGTGQGPGFSSGPAAAVQILQTSGQPCINAQGYRRWQGAGADTLTDTMGVFDDFEDPASLPMERTASAAPKSPAEAAAAGEQLWLRNVCGVRPEAVGEVLNSCGLLNSGGDPFVDIQIGHTAGGAGTLVWHEATGQWTMASAAVGALPSAITTVPPSSCSFEAPTLWLPTAVVLLARGARVLQDIRVVSTAVSCASSRSDVVDELTVRSACGYLPIRTAAGIRMHAGGGGSGSSVPPLPLLLEDDPVVESLVDSACVWRLVDVGGALPRNGGLLLVECRLTTPTVRRPQGSLLDLPHGTLAPALGPAIVTSAPVPLLVLPEQQAEAAMELQRLRIYMARLLLGSEDVLRTVVGSQAAGGVSVQAPQGLARADAAAQVEMACQQFLMDLGVLLDAASSATASANSLLLPVKCPTPAPGPSSCPQPGVSTGSGGGTLGQGNGITCGGSSVTARPPPHSFSETQSVVHSKRPQLPELQVSPVCTTDVLSSMPSCSSPLTVFGGCGVGRGTEIMAAWASEAGGGGCASSGTASDVNPNFAEDMRCLMQPHRASVAGFDTAHGSGSSSTTAAGPVVTEFGEHLMDVACTVLAGCCAASMQRTAMLVLEIACGNLSLATPEVLLAEAGADPRMSMELLSTYQAHSRQGPSDNGRRSNSVSTAGPCMAHDSTNVAAAAPGAGTSPDGNGGVAAKSERFSEAGWSSTINGNAMANSSRSRSHSLAMMLVGSRSGPTSPIALAARSGEEAAAADFAGWQEHANHMLRFPVQQRELEPIDVAAAMSGEDNARTMSLLRPSGMSPCAVALGVEISHQGSTTSDLMPTWGSISAAGTPDTGNRTSSRSRLAANLLGSADMAMAGSSQDGLGGATPPGPRYPQDAVSVTGSMQVRVSSTAPAAFVGEYTITSCDASSNSEASRLVSARQSNSSYDEGSCCASSTGKFSGAGCSTGASPAEEGQEDTDNGDCWLWQRHGGLADTLAPGQDVTGGVAAAAASPRNGSDSWAGWTMYFLNPFMSAEYMQFVATRTCSIMWSYFICNAVISVVSCTRAWVEDGLDSCLTFAIFSGLPAAILGWYCIRHGARDGRAMVMATVACKFVRLVSEVLMGLRVLRVPSLMEPMSNRGIEVWSEALMRPVAERMPLVSYCMMTTLELPCIWLMYRHFQANFPDCGLRNYPFLRTLIFVILSSVVNALAEFYWRREFQRWSLRIAAGGGSADLAAVGLRAHAFWGDDLHDTKARWKDE
ncbi:hypothetical protein Vafri_18639 [Volvox africanus]|uniref:Uncharacterized protein n=1 Tax=Volvox africanus TaxID=51714 RepID=A0A8J4FC07_9CHLO|nr:hypothetical protein Vafri_18639 [Volvox africanus]